MINEPGVILYNAGFVYFSMKKDLNYIIYV